MPCLARHHAPLQLQRPRRLPLLLGAAVCMAAPLQHSSSTRSNRTYTNSSSSSSSRH
jgi:hypothetical protein